MNFFIVDVWVPNYFVWVPNYFLGVQVSKKLYCHKRTILDYQTVEQSQHDSNNGQGKEAEEDSEGG